VSLLELLERCCAEVGVEPLAIDGNGLEFAQVRVAGYFVVLVSLIPFQTSQLNSLGIAVEKIGVVIRVFCRDQNHVHVRTVGRLEVGQAKKEFPVCLLVNDFVREAVPFYSNLREDMLRVVLVHPGDVILPELGEKLGLYTQKKLAERGVEIRVNTKVSSVSDHCIRLSTGEMIQSHALIWTAGTSPNPVLDRFPCAKERGRLKVDEMLQVPDQPGVWALGDCALVPNGKTGQYYPPTAQHALRQGKVLAKNLIASVRGGVMRPFSFATIGQLASIGRRTGVANICGINFSGFMAWWLWRTIYLSKLPRFEKKLRVALDWTLDLLFTKDLVQFQTFQAPTVSHTDDDVEAQPVTASPIVAQVGS